MGIKAVNSGELEAAFPASVTTPGMVRNLVELRLAEWGLRHLAGDVLLVACELITNAIRNTPDREIRVRFTREAGGVVLAVWDSSDALPVAKPVVELNLDDVVPDPYALDPGHDAGTGGWGLPLVEALSSECGVTTTDPSGKWVWARVAV